MSSETILPPEGPEGPKKQLQEETNPLLSKSTDKCNTCTDESSDATETSQTPIPGDASSDGQDHMSENHTHDDLVRTQPQPLPRLATSQQHGIDGEAGRQQNSLHTVLSNGHGTPRGVTQTPSTSPTSESRKHPSPVSHRMQRKLRSSLSVNSDNSRRSKSSSTGSNKPGSTPEDCCVHCILACLFCEFLTLCNMVVAQASCGICTSEACCCCCCADDLGDDCNCPCDMDCGIMDACCESSDCLEICMECCGICFPT
ncbi:myoD family inhibitor domain-containing protein-like isoform X1 [Carassius carassius]|uniref:myoD family inhibitor domain-containing protein-like isoform X1 n=1 Tax=Carassius carassius TaxID=217509 RepID=UPI00286925B0|nr:myoD family inhibitor domain-containing protein-like isoform X1 [Carassius carassius]